MSYYLDDTIAAISSALGGSFQGMIRLSGPGVLVCLQSCFSAEPETVIEEIAQPQAICGILALADPLGNIPCDLYYWPDERSYTRQPVAEIHLIGSVPLLDAALEKFCAAGARLAEPGEFTLRAFVAGRLDLTQAEAVLGVIDAADPQQLKAALSQLAGGLSSPLGKVRDQLLDLLAHLEAGLDFVEEDVEFISAQELEKQLGDAAEKIAALAEQMTDRDAATSATRVTLLGAANVGKSSLFNALTQDQAAIVSEQAGTTRDYVTRHVEFFGLPCLLIDTAGVQPASADDPLAGAAQQMTSDQSRQSHLQLFCLDASRPLTDWEQTELDKNSNVERIIVLTKIDQPRELVLDDPCVETSSKTDTGLEQLRRQIVETIRQANTQETNVVRNTAQRCRKSLRLSAERLQEAGHLAMTQAGEELVAVEIRSALEELGAVVGAIYTDDILDRIFSRFCIGK